MEPRSPTPATPLRPAPQSLATLRRELSALEAAGRADHELLGRVSRARRRVERKRALRRELARLAVSR